MLGFQTVAIRVEPRLIGSMRSFIFVAEVHTSTIKKRRYLLLFYLYFFNEIMTLLLKICVVEAMSLVRHNVCFRKVLQKELLVQVKQLNPLFAHD